MLYKQHAHKSLNNLSNVAINTSLISDTDSIDNLGSATKYWANAYIDKIFLNATATLDGITAGLVNITGNLTASGLIKGTGVETTNTTGIIIPASSTYAFTRTGDADTGLYFNVSSLRFEFHRDANILATIGAVIGQGDITANRDLISGRNVAVSSDNKIQLKGTTGDTYMIFNSTLGRIEFYLNNVLEGYINTTGFVSA